MGLLSAFFGQQGMSRGLPGLQWNGSGWVMPQSQQQQAPQPITPVQMPAIAPMQPLAGPAASPLAALNTSPKMGMAEPQQRGQNMFSRAVFGAQPEQGQGFRQPGLFERVIFGSNAINQNAQTQLEQQRFAQDARRQKIGDARDETTWGRQQTEWSREDEQRQAWQAAVAGETDPQRRATLQALGPQGYGEWMAGEQNRQFQAREGQLDRDVQMRAAQIRSANENSLGRYFQSMDAQTLGDLNQQAAQLQAVGLPQLRNLRNTITQASGLTGQPVDYDSRISLGRYFNGSSPERQTLEVWRAQILGPALETLRGLGAMSEREMEAAVNSFSNPDMQMGAAMQLIDQRIADAERRVATAQAAGTFFQEAQGITGTRNAAGQDWPTYLQGQLGQTAGAGTNEGNLIPRGGFRTPPPAAIAELRANTSAAVRAEFDQTFGPGAAARALGGAQSSATGVVDRFRNWAGGIEGNYRSRLEQVANDPRVPAARREAARRALERQQGR